MITIGTTASNRPIEIPTSHLANHAAIFGASGSGKTGLLISIMEQLIEKKVPILALDIKGDLVNILKQEPEYRGFYPKVLTPGANHGNPVDLFSRITDPSQTDMIVTSLLKLMGVESSRTQESYHLYLTSIVKYYADVHPRMQLEELLPLVLNPGIERLGMLDVDEVLPKLQRRTLAHKLNNIIASPSFDLWRSGVSLNFDELFNGPATPVVIFSVAHLVDEEERMMALSFVLNEYLRWTIAQTGSTELRSVLIVDECTGLMPPYPKNPSTKTPLMTLLKQARAFGNGIILGTQNPKDIDYKGLAQCKTWITGQLKTKNDRTRILEGLSGLDISPKALDEKMASLSSREFVINSGPKFAVVKSLDTKVQLSGPMTSKELQQVYSEGYYQKLETLLTVRNYFVSMAVDRTPTEPTKTSSFKEVWSNLWK